VHADIERLLGRKDGTFPSSEPKVHVVASVSHEETVDGGPMVWVVSLTITRPTSEKPHERRVEGKTCREVADATAVIVAIALDPTTGRLFLSTGRFKPASAPTADNPRPRRQGEPGTFEVLVVGR